MKKRKIKYSAIFFLCWFALLVLLVDGVLKFQTLVDYFGSYAVVEVALLLLVVLPTLAVYRFTKEKVQLSPLFQRLTDKGLKENEHEDIRKHYLVDLWRAAYCH